jgi:uncharacterized membrane protein YgdD (TMEM256/DUF423 family)
MHRFWIIAGALNMLAALVFAAATGHATQGEFIPVALRTLDTARDMHFIHAVGLILIGVLVVQFGPRVLLNVAGSAFLIGITCFCGGIDATYGPLALPATMLIPIGGVAFMSGWIMLAIAAWGMTAKAP